MNEPEYVQLCWQGGDGPCVFKLCIHTKLWNANKHVSTPTLSPDSEPSGAFCLQAARNPSRKFTINASIKHSGPGCSPMEAVWQPGIQMCYLRGESHSHLVLSVIRIGTWTPGALAWITLTLMGNVTKEGRVKVWQAPVSFWKISSPGNLLSVMLLCDTRG